MSADWSASIDLSILVAITFMIVYACTVLILPQTISIKLLNDIIYHSIIFRCQLHQAIRQRFIVYSADRLYHSWVRSLDYLTIVPLNHIKLLERR